MAHLLEYWRNNGDCAYIKGSKRLYNIGTEHEWQVSETVNGKPVYRNYNSFEEALEGE